MCTFITEGIGLLYKFSLVGKLAANPGAGLELFFPPKLRNLLSKLLQYAGSIKGKWYRLLDALQ